MKIRPRSLYQVSEQENSTSEAGAGRLIRRYTKEELQYLKENYSDNPTNDIAEYLGRSVHAIHSKAHGLGLKKSDSYLETMFEKVLLQYGSSKRFLKGMVPWNKGIRYPMPNNPTKFKKGNLPVQTKYDGCITVRHDGNMEYKYIRVSMGKWMPLHAYNWIRANGDIPKGHIVIMKDTTLEDREKLDNLELVSRKENMIRNSIHRYPDDLKSAIMTLGKLKKAIKNEQKNNNE